MRQRVRAMTGLFVDALYHSASVFVIPRIKGFERTLFWRIFVFLPTKSYFDSRSSISVLGTKEHWKLFLLLSGSRVPLLSEIFQNMLFMRMRLTLRSPSLGGQVEAISEAGVKLVYRMLSVFVQKIYIPLSQCLLKSLSLPFVFTFLWDKKFHFIQGLNFGTKNVKCLHAFALAESTRLHFDKFFSLPQTGCSFHFLHPWLIPESTKCKAWANPEEVFWSAVMELEIWWSRWWYLFWC